MVLFPHAVLTVEQMYKADSAAMAAGVSGPRLMETAGWVVAREIRRRWSRRPVTILCGPGNNGGDGFVVARILKRGGWPVKVALLGERQALAGDAALNAGRWDGPVLPLAPEALDGAGLVVDALFGAGLARSLQGMVRQVVEEIGERALPCIAIDMPSGVHGDTGHVLGAAPIATLTVTFFRPKPGHLLLPGRLHCGELVVADIGIPDSVLSDLGRLIQVNHPGLWHLPELSAMDHKYRRGHAVVVAGAMLPGAARLAAHAARRVGAGLVTVAAPEPALAVVAADQPGLLLVPLDHFQALLADERRNAYLIGPGSGIGAETAGRVLAALKMRKRCVLDADALTSFVPVRAELFKALNGHSLLTPHEGEFARLFGHTGARLERARAAAAECGAVVLLKGADTVIAAPDGRLAINANGPPTLATAGSGDVLAGLVVGLMAQGMETFEATCAAAWLHGEAARRFGRGLIAEDIAEQLPAVLASLA